MDTASEDRSFAPERARPAPEAPASKTLERGGVQALAAAYDDLSELYLILVEDADARAERYLGLVAETGDYKAAAQAQHEALRFICGLGEAEQRAEEAGLLLAELEARIVRAPVATYDDLRLKALVLQKSLEARSPQIEIDQTDALRCLVRDITGAGAA